MRRLLALALLPLSGCIHPSPHTTEWSGTYRVSTRDIALGLLNAPEAGPFECRIDGEPVESAVAIRRLRELRPDESVRLALASDEGSVELVVGGDAAITVDDGRCSWSSEVRSRGRWW
jgi:hypothetical protein